MAVMRRRLLMFYREGEGSRIGNSRQMHLVESQEREEQEAILAAQRGAEQLWENGPC